MQAPSIRREDRRSYTSATSHQAEISDLKRSLEASGEISSIAAFPVPKARPPQRPAVAPPSSLPEEETFDFPDEEPASHVRFTREQRRSRRKRAIRARTINISRFAKSAIELGRRLHPELEITRPLTRKDCENMPRPCPFVSCRHHLYLDVSPKTGSIKLNFPDLEVWELGQSCSLDVAERGPVGPEDLGAIMNLTRERVRQLQQRSLDKARFGLEMLPPSE